MSIEARFHTALLNPEQGVPGELFSWNSSDTTQRFNIYRNNLVVSLIEALSSTFDVTQQLVGRRFFRALAREYVPDNLPDSPVLALYGEHFPDFLEHFPPAAQLPWLADMARLEWLRVRAYHAADAAPLSSRTVAARHEDPQQLLNARVQLHPSLGVLDSEHAVASLWAAHQGQGQVADVAINSPQEVLILRPEFDVDVIILPAGGADFVRLLQTGASLGSVMTHTLEQQPDSHPQHILEILMGSGALIGLQPEQEYKP